MIIEKTSAENSEACSEGRFFHVTKQRGRLSGRGPCSAPFGQGQPSPIFFPGVCPFPAEGTPLSLSLSHGDASTKAKAGLWLKFPEKQAQISRLQKSRKATRSIRLALIILTLVESCRRSRHHQSIAMLRVCTGRARKVHGLPARSRLSRTVSSLA